ncbi:hypothetical protein sos41_03190 [Alphaproteobacteria bacterium SO-S41]|nr:hypothetical protein sos41_03190 [Alphaproteobacteria bacterium SO-S41]
MTPRPRYAPYADGVAGFRIGVLPLDVRDWIEPDGQAAVQFANKAAQLGTRHGEVVAALPGSEAAQREVLELLAAYLRARFPGLYRRDGDLIDVTAAGWRVDLADETLAPIDRAARLVQEDLCLLQAGADGAYVLTAASLSAPNVWRLHDKLGQAMAGIHGPVPDYAEAMGTRVDRMFTHIRAELPVWRSNWSVMTDAALYQPQPHDRSDARLEGLDAGNAGERLVIRVERQTLRRLPETGAILFTIKTHIDPLNALAGHDDLIAGLTRAVSDMPQGMTAYKALAPIRGALLGWLANAARG